MKKITNYNELAYYVWQSDYINKWIESICKDKNYLDDLKAHCILEMYKLEEKFLIKLYNENKFDKYYIQLVRFQYVSKTSSFYKEYINSGFWKLKPRTETELENMKFIEEETAEERVIRYKVLFFKLLRLLNSSNAFKVDLFKMYYFNGFSYKEVADYYGISYQVARNKINSVRSYIIKNLKL